MSKMHDYIEDVSQWNEQLRDFLASENVDKENELWKRLDVFADVMNGLDASLSTEELLSVQSQVEILHEEMENYFRERHTLGTIFAPSSAVIGAGKHVLPPLPYPYDALEPHISAEIMRLHHNEHHKSYVDGLNKAEEKLKHARENEDFELIKHWSRELAFHGSGHYLHTIFWNNMSPKGGGKPTGALLKEIEKYFGSFERFKKQFSAAAKQVEGVGWALLVWAPRANRLEILQSERHMILTQWDTIPLLVLDVWEHAYYLQYKTKKAAYVDNWWNIVNWKDVADRYLKASELKWKPY